jgi:predicted MFS family arabinose efflux permease
MLAFLGSAGITDVNIMPALVDGLIHGLGFTTEEAGLVSATNVYGAAIGALAAAFFAHLLPWKPVAAGLIAALVLADLASIPLTTVAALLPVRLLDGIAGGYLVGTAFAVIARTANPDRVFGVMMVVQFGYAGLGVMLLPGLVASCGTAVLFLALIAFSLATLAMLPFLGRYPAREPGAPAGAGSAPGWALLLTLVGIFLFQAANNAVSAYLIGLGEGAGLSQDFVSGALGSAYWISILGAGLAIGLAGRMGRLRPLAGGLVLAVAGMSVLLHSQIPALFLAANVVGSITWSLVLPYLFGLAAAFGQGGRAAALGGFCSKAGLATGPLIGGYLVADGNYARLVWAGMAGVAAASAATLLAARQMDRGRG